MRTIDKRHGHTPTEEELEHQEDNDICEAVQGAIMASVVIKALPVHTGLW